MLGPQEAPGVTRGEPYWFKTTGRGLPGVVYLRLAQRENAKWVCTGMLIDSEGEELTTKAVRSIPISTLIDDLVLQNGGAADLIWNAMNTVDLGANGGGILIPAATGTMPAGRPKRGGPGLNTKTKREEFAEVYKRALNTNRRSPVTAVANHYGVSLGTVRNWRARCIKEGLID